MKRLFTFLHLDNQVTFLIGHLGCYGNHLHIKSGWDVREAVEGGGGANPNPCSIDFFFMQIAIGS